MKWFLIEFGRKSGKSRVGNYTIMVILEKASTTKNFHITRKSVIILSSFKSF